MSDERVPTIAAVRTRTRVVVTWAAVAFALGLASAGAALMQARALRGASFLALDLRAVDRADLAAVVTSAALTVTLLAGLAAWSWWTRAAYALAASLGLRSLRSTASRASWSFVIPVIQAWRPFMALADLARNLDAQRLPAKPPQAATDASGHYRESAGDRGSADLPLPPVPIGAWWALWLSGFLLSAVASFARTPFSTASQLRVSLWIDLSSQLALALAALCAGRVALGLDARLRERAARASDAAA